MIRFIWFFDFFKVLNSFPVSHFIFDGVVRRRYSRQSGAVEVLRSAGSDTEGRRRCKGVRFRVRRHRAAEAPYHTAG